MFEIFQNLETIFKLFDIKNIFATATIFSQHKHIFYALFYFLNIFWS